jgi:hypothetical protein
MMTDDEEGTTYETAQGMKPKGLRCVWTSPTKVIAALPASSIAPKLLLVGTRGNVPAPALGTQKSSIIVAPVRAHTEKPDVMLDMIEQFFPHLPKIELHRRGPAARRLGFLEPGGRMSSPREITMTIPDEAKGYARTGGGRNGIRFTPRAQRDYAATL